MAVHIGIRGNETADQMAKEAIKIDNISVAVTLSRVEGKSGIKQVFRSKWQKNWNSREKGRHFYRKIKLIIIKVGRTLLYIQD